MSVNDIDDVINEDQTSSGASPENKGTESAVKPAEKIETKVEKRDNSTTTGSANDRIRQLVKENKELKTKIQLRNSDDSNSANDDLDEPEQFVVDVVKKEFGGVLEQAASAQQAVELGRALSKTPVAEQYRDEIKKYGEVHSTLPWEDVVALVLSKHNETTQGSTKEQANSDARESALGGHPNPGARREPSIRSKSTKDLEDEIRNSSREDIEDSLIGGLY